MPERYSAIRDGQAQEKASQKSAIHACSAIGSIGFGAIPHMFCFGEWGAKCGFTDRVQPGSESALRAARQAGAPKVA